MPLTCCLRLPVLALLCLLALPATSALAARSGAQRPVVSSIGPANAGVGDTLTIRGRNLAGGKGRTSVAFRRAGAAPVSVTAATATRTRITVVVPAALTRSLTIVAGIAQPTRFGVRVRARRTSKWYSTPKLSALIAPAIGALGRPAHCSPDGATPGGTVDDVLDDVVYSLDDDPAALIDDVTDPVEAAAEKTLCSGAGASVADDPAAPDVTDPGTDPDDAGDLDPQP
jgi:hypothetical protein